MPLDSGVDSGLGPALPEALWEPVAERLEGRPFLRSEGMAAPIAMPAVAEPWLVAEAEELVARFDRFYAAIVGAEGPLEDEPARKIGEPYESFARIEGERPALPLSRLDCVLDGKKLRVIELNPIGVSTLHLRAVSYLTRALVRDGAPELEAAARALGAFRADKMASVRRFIDATLAEPPAHPTVAILLLPGVHRGTKHVWRHELEQAGMDVVFGHPRELAYDPRGVTLAGRRVHAIYADWFLYLGYQQTRYEQTKFESRVGDFSTSGNLAAQLLEQLGLVAAVVDRRVTLISPMRGYRALSKALLAWVDRPDLALSDDDRAFVRDHLAQTWDHHARASSLTVAQALDERGSLVLKPCRFGGSHGVVIGGECGAAEWEGQLRRVWTDPEWIVQRYVAPNVDVHGMKLSYGVYNYAGTLGGILVRAARSSVVSARSAEIIATIKLPITIASR